MINGHYSTICYTDQSLHAVARLLHKLGLDPRSLHHLVDAWFLHRPYHRMPINVMAALYVWGLARDAEGRVELETLCRDAGADFDEMLAEAYSSPDLFTDAPGGGIDGGAYPQATKVVKHFRDTPKFEEVVSQKMCLGMAGAKEIGNVYTASLPAWIAAGMDDALERGVDLTGKIAFTLGYGSGDAAEAMLIRFTPRWRDAAQRSGFKEAFAGAIDLKREEYEALHDGFAAPCPASAPSGRFGVERTGDTDGPDFQDLGIDYYRYFP